MKKEMTKKEAIETVNKAIELIDAGLMDGDYLSHLWAVSSVSIAPKSGHFQFWTMSEYHTLFTPYCFSESDKLDGFSKSDAFIIGYFDGYTKSDKVGKAESSSKIGHLFTKRAVEAFVDYYKRVDEMREIEALRDYSLEAESKGVKRNIVTLKEAFEYGQFSFMSDGQEFFVNVNEYDDLYYTVTKVTKRWYYFEEDFEISDTFESVDEMPEDLEAHFGEIYGIQMNRYDCFGSFTFLEKNILKGWSDTKLVRDAIYSIAYAVDYGLEDGILEFTNYEKEDLFFEVAQEIADGKFDAVSLEKMFNSIEELTANYNLKVPSNLEEKKLDDAFEKTRSIKEHLGEFAFKAICYVRGQGVQ